MTAAGISATYHARLTACLASRDRAEAASLLKEVQGALAARTASGPGFDHDVITLSRIAGVPLAKGAEAASLPAKKRQGVGARRAMSAMRKAAPRPSLPVHLEADAAEAVRLIKAAKTPRERMEAHKHGLLVKARCDDFVAGRVSAEELIRAAQRAPKRGF